MSITNQNYADKLHRIKVKLYRNFLPGRQGKYYARTANEDSLSIEDICNMMKTRGGFTGDRALLLDNVRCFFREMAYQLCDGYCVNLGYFSVYPNIGGTFDSANEPFDSEKHKITFRYRTNTALRVLIKEIGVLINGVSDSNANISKFSDNEEILPKNHFLPDHMFTIKGKKIKLEGDDPGCGVFFVPVDDPSKAVKVTRIALNTPTKIVGIAPNTNYAVNRIEVRTQYSGSKHTPLKEPRVIVGDFTVEAD